MNECLKISYLNILFKYLFDAKCKFILNSTIIRILWILFNLINQHFHNKIKMSQGLLHIIKIK